MKDVLKNLQLNENLSGKVVEIFPDGELLMSFSGSLIRVQNESNQPLQLGQVVTVIVKAISPIRLKLRQNRRDQRRRGHIDVSV